MKEEWLCHRNYGTDKKELTHGRSLEKKVCPVIERYLASLWVNMHRKELKNKKATKGRENIAFLSPALPTMNLSLLLKDLTSERIIGLGKEAFG